MKYNSKGKKGIIKIGQKALTTEESNKLALIAPGASINIIKNYKNIENAYKIGNFPFVEEGVIKNEELIMGEFIDHPCITCRILDRSLEINIEIPRAIRKVFRLIYLHKSYKHLHLDNYI